MLRRLLVLLLAAAVHLAGAVGHALLQRRPAQLVLDAAEEIRFVERLVVLVAAVVQPLGDYNV